MIVFPITWRRCRFVYYAAPIADETIALFGAVLAGSWHVHAHDHSDALYIPGSDERSFVNVLSSCNRHELEQYCRSEHRIRLRTAHVRSVVDTLRAGTAVVVMCCVRLLVHISV